jgi:repressor LexA
MSIELPERQQRVLNFIQSYLEQSGYPPTVREIGDAVGIKSTSLVTYYLDRLEEKGHITRDRSISRGIRLTGETLNPEAIYHNENAISIPYLGYIVAGQPIPVDALPGEETVELNRALFGRDVSDLFALTVQGESMIDALVNDGDLVILRHQERVENGEMAAVWLPSTGETTLKKVYYEGSRVRLQPANPTMKPMYYPAEQVLIQGKVVMVVRRLE